LNVAFIVAALALPSWFLARGHDPLFALVVGVLLGGALQVLAQWPSLARVGYLGAPRLAFGHAAVREVLRRMAPVLVGFGVYYVDVVAARHLLSALGQGAPSFFTFAQRLCDFPQGIFVMALQTATLPALATLAARGDRLELARTFENGLRLALFVAVPATFALALLSEPLVMLLFERGQFTRQDTLETAASLVGQGAGIWAVACIRQLVIVFFALGDTRTPVVVASLDFLVFLGLAFALKGPFGHVGVAWAVTGASVAQMAMLGFGLRHRLGSLPILGLAKRTAIVAVCSLLAGLPARELGRFLMPEPEATALARAIPGVAASAVFVVAFVILAYVLRVPELRSMWNLVSSRWRRRRPPR
jgi:putative peptidoglycan lipid II flippase